MHRTDLTSEIDGALAGRNLGSRHFSEIARSGNGNMLSDLSEADLADYSELDGVGEALEDLSLDESASIDGLGRFAPFKKFRLPKPGEVAPFAAKKGMVWVRKRVATDMRRPGGPRVARVKWAQMTPARLSAVRAEGQLQGFEIGSGLMISAGVGLALGVVFLVFMKMRKH